MARKSAGRHARPRWISIGLAAVPVALLAYYVAWASYVLPERAFTPVAWKAARPPERATMIVDLLRAHLRTGMLETDVRSMLGTPTSVATAAEKGDTQRGLLYSIGMHRNPAVRTPGYLYLTFEGTPPRLVRAGVGQDD